MNLDIKNIPKHYENIMKIITCLTHVTPLKIIPRITFPHRKSNVFKTNCKKMFLVLDNAICALSFQSIFHIIYSFFN